MTDHKIDDTRLLRIKDDLETALEVVRTMYDECLRAEPEIAKILGEVLRDTRHALTGIVSISVQPICGASAVLGAVCYRQAGHDGPHRSADRHQEWTDESNAAATEWMLKNV